MTYTYAITGDATLVEVACPGRDELVVITADAPYESDTSLAIDVPGVEETSEPAPEPPPEDPPADEPPADPVPDEGTAS